MKKIVKLSESQLLDIVKKVINESESKVYTDKAEYDKALALYNRVDEVVNIWNTRKEVVKTLRVPANKSILNKTEEQLRKFCFDTEFNLVKKKLDVKYILTLDMFEKETRSYIKKKYITGSKKGNNVDYSFYYKNGELFTKPGFFYDNLVASHGVSVNMPFYINNGLYYLASFGSYNAVFKLNIKKPIFKEPSLPPPSTPPTTLPKQEPNDILMPDGTKWTKDKFIGQYGQSVWDKYTKK